MSKHISWCQWYRQQKTDPRFRGLPSLDEFLEMRRGRRRKRKKAEWCPEDVIPKPQICVERVIPEKLILKAADMMLNLDEKTKWDVARYLYELADTYAFIYSGLVKDIYEGWDGYEVLADIVVGHVYDEVFKLTDDEIYMLSLILGNMWRLECGE